MYLDRAFINSKLKIVYKYRRVANWSDFFSTISNLYSLDTQFGVQFPTVAEAIEDGIKQDIQTLNEMKGDIQELTGPAEEYDAIEEIVYRITQNYLFLD